VLEGSWYALAWGAGQVWVLVEPGGVGGKVALPCLHLVHSPCHNFPQTHEGVWAVGGEVLLVRGSGGGCGPVLEVQVSRASSQGLVGLAHELWGGENVCPKWGGGVQDEREVCEAS